MKESEGFNQKHIHITHRHNSVVTATSRGKGVREAGEGGQRGLGVGTERDFT